MSQDLTAAPSNLRRIGAAVLDVLLLFQPMMWAANIARHFSREVADITAVGAMFVSLVFFVADIVLLAKRSQTLAMALLGLAFRDANARIVSGVRLIALRLVLPVAALLACMAIPQGHWLAALVNFTPLWFPGHATLVDRVTRTRIVRIA